MIPTSVIYPGQPPEYPAWVAGLVIVLALLASCLILGART